MHHVVDMHLVHLIWVGFREHDIDCCPTTQQLKLLGEMGYNPSYKDESDMY